MKKIIINILLAMLCAVATGQNARLSGSIADSRSREPIPFANAALLRPDDSLFVRGATADLDGHFAIDIQPGQYLLKVTCVGYEEFIQTLDLHGSRQLDLQLRSGATLREVQVKGVRPIFTMDGEKNIYNTSDDPSVQSGTVVDALQNAPGIEVDADGNIRLRGTQEVSVWIDGRQCRMNPEALKQYLRTLPASKLRRIEVITNPSARYGGSNPVVNIVTQGKSRDNSFVSLGLNGSSKPEATPWASYIFCNDSWDIDLYANFSRMRDRYTAQGRESLLSNAGDTSRTDDYSLEHSFLDNNALMLAEAAYHLDTLTDLFLWLSLMPTGSSWEQSTRMRRREHLYAPGDYSYAETLGKPMSRNFGFEDGIAYEHRFDDTSGHMLEVAYFGSGFWSDSTIHGQRIYASLPLRSIDFNEQHNQRIIFHGFEANYNLPFGQRDSASGSFRNELEAGFEGCYEKSSASAAFDSLADGTAHRLAWLSAESLQATLSGALYANLLHRRGPFSAKIGLRGELNDGRIDYPDRSEFSFVRRDHALVPSLHLAYASPSGHMLSLSYTRRMGMPFASQSTARRTYSLDGYSVGNPDLVGSHAHSVEMQWDKYSDNIGAVGLRAFYTATTDQQEVLTDVILDDRVFHRLVVFSQPVNVGNCWNSGIDLHAVYRPHANLNVRLNATLFYDHLSLRYRPDQEPYANGMLCYSLRLNAWVKLWNQLQLFANAHYSSPTQSLFVTTLSRKSLDLGLNADLFRRALSVNISANDIFGWNQWASASANPFLPSDKTTVPQSRYVSFGLTLRLGQMELEREPRNLRKKE